MSFLYLPAQVAGFSQASTSSDGELSAIDKKQEVDDE